MAINNVATLEDIKKDFYELRMYMRKCKQDTIKWMAFFAITQPIVVYIILTWVIDK